MSNPSLLIARTGRLSDNDSLYLLSAETDEFDEVLQSKTSQEGFNYTRASIPYGLGDFLNKTPNKTARTKAFALKLKAHLCTGQDEDQFSDEFLDSENIVTYFPPSGGKSFGSSGGKKEFTSEVMGLVGSKEQNRVLQLKTTGPAGKHTVHVLPGRPVSFTGAKYLWLFSNNLLGDSKGRFFAKGTADDLSELVGKVSVSSKKDLLYAMVTNSHVFASDWTKEAYDQDDKLPPIAIRFEVFPDKTRECVEALLSELVQDTDSVKGADYYLSFYEGKVKHITSHTVSNPVKVMKKKRSSKLKKALDEAKEENKEQVEEQPSLLDSCMFGDDEMDMLL